MMADKKQQQPIDRTRLGLYMQESSNIFAENRLVRLVLLGMVIWSSINSVMLQNALDARTVVIMPPDGSYKYELTNEQLSDKYLYRMARYITFMVGNMTAATGRDQLNEVLMMIHPSRYGQYQGHFNQLAKEIERYPNISYVIELNGNKAIDVEGNIITVDTTKKRLIGNTITREDRVTYEIEFKVESGQFWIIDAQEISKASESNDDEL